MKQNTEEWAWNLFAMITERGRQFSVHLAAQVNQACLAECWAEGCFHALKFPVLAKGNLLSLHKDFHGCKINTLSLESKCNRLCFEENTKCASCHFCRADKDGGCVFVCVRCSVTGENSCPLNTFPTKPLQLDWVHDAQFMSIMDPLKQQWADGGSPSKNSHTFLSFQPQLDFLMLDGEY